MGTNRLKRKNQPQKIQLKDPRIKIRTKRERIVTGFQVNLTSRLRPKITGEEMMIALIAVVTTTLIIKQSQIASGNLNLESFLI